MKFKLSILIAFAALFIFFGNTNVCYGQTEPIAGGYGDADVTDENVVAAAKFAIRKQSRKQKATLALVEIKTAKMQVVAGLNYEVCMVISSKAKLKSKPVEQFVKTVVYKNLNNFYSLTSWKVLKKPEECAN
ncbi:MAG: cystatin domain-containing protein [Pyrinomonadaceae bacterium]|nr:cystatin domain-containing protein [Pyrinomonadaceae bacterium]